EASSARTASPWSKASTWPRLTTSPTLTSTSTSRRPDSSAPTMVSCQAAIEPWAVTLLVQLLVSGRTTLTLRAGLGAEADDAEAAAPPAAVSSLPQALNRATAAATIIQEARKFRTLDI